MNYTTGVSASRSITEIEQMITLFGASATMKENAGDGRIQSLAFKIGDKTYKLPANAEGVKKVLYDGKRNSSRRDAMRNRDENSYNVAWRIMKDWVHAQLSIVASGQAQPDEVLLPYMYDAKSNRTLYQAFKEGHLQLMNKGDDDSTKSISYEQEEVSQ